MKKKESVLGEGLSSILNDPSNNSLKISERSNPNYSKNFTKKNFTKAKSAQNKFQQ